MSIPLAFLSTLPPPSAETSLGDQLAAEVTDSGRYRTLLDCLCTTDGPALWSPDTSRPALHHRELSDFISNFFLPTSGLHSQLGPNDRVMVVLPTGPENALVLLAVASYHTCAPVNSSCTAAELSEDVKRLKAKAVVATPDAVDRLELRTLRSKLQCEVILVHGRADGPAGLFGMSVMDESDDDETWDVVGCTERAPSRLHGLDDQSLVLHTSGTSGKKKVVPYSLRSLIIGTCAVMKSWDLQPQDVNMNMMPLFHVGGIVRNLWAPMFSGGSAVMCAGFDASAFWNVIMERGATWYYAAPTMHHAILSSRPETIVPSRDSRIRMIANAAGGLLPTLASDLKQTFNAVILPSYGMTECMPIASPPTTYQLDRPGCSGVACGPYLSIRDPFDLERELSSGSTGAVCVRGLPTFQGYEVDPDLPLDTSAFSTEGWFDSGDMGYLDEDGYLFITGRSKEIINKGGEVISPFEIEEAIMSIAKDKVKATLAFSAEHDVLQETIAVVIVPVPGSPRTGLAELQDLLKANLHPSKWPFAIVYMDDLPKNNAGKPLRIKLAQRLGLGCLTDDTPALARHYEATAPDKNAPLSEPISCQRVTLDLTRVHETLQNMRGVQEVAVRQKKDGSPEALVSVAPDSDLDSVAVIEVLAQTIDAYCIPSPLHVLFDKLAKTAGGEVDYDRMEEEIQRRNASALSPTALVVRNTIAQLLDIEPGPITKDSDFFLLGGNSLLLGRLAYYLRKETGVTLQISAIFTNSTVCGIAALIEEESGNISSKTTLHSAQASVFGEKGEKHRGDASDSNSIDIESLSYGSSGGRRGQTHPLALIVQVIPLVFFYPLKAAWTWTVIVFVLSMFTNFTQAGYFMRLGCLLCAIVVARLSARVLCPIAAILFKWVIIGRYKPGTYPMWGSYHLRWWIVNQSLRVGGRGIFSMHPSLEVLYYRLLGARIGKDVKIDKMAKLGEYDLLTLHDGCRIDKALVRGFCVEREGYFCLDNIVIGQGAVINTYTHISPGASVPAATVYGPHASSHEGPAPDVHAKYNRTMARKPHWALNLFVCTPIILLVKFICYLPWFAALFGLMSQSISGPGLNSLELVILWFASPQRIMWHALARVIRVVFPPLIQLVLGIVVKRLMGLNREGLVDSASQWTLVRRHINHALLSQRDLSRAFDILGTHYEMTSCVYRAMGAKIGKHVYWPGSGVYCPDPELLEVGDDVVFGSRSELFTSDCIGSEKIIIKSGAMIADRVVLLPGTTVGRRTVMGSGALGKRNGNYQDGSVWMGCDRGEAVCFGRGGKDVSGDTITPFGKAFYKREASFFVFPYPMLLAINLLVAGVCAGFWSMGAIAVTQALNQLRMHLHRTIFGDTWYRFFVLFGFISIFFILALNIQAYIALTWVILTKWLVIGRRKEGQYDWDKSNYCQRWQLHLVLSRVLHRSYGNGGVLGNLTGSAYIVWFYRALGAKIGRDVALFAGGRVGLMTEPDLVELGDRVCLDDCSVVAHINSRGNFSLNRLKIGDSCAMRSGSRLLSGASMDENSMLLEHTLLTSGEIAEKDSVYAGWPAKPIDYFRLTRFFKSQVRTGGKGLPSYSDLEKHHYKLEEEKRRLEEMLQKTEKMMARVRKGMRHMKDESHYGGGK